MHDHWQVILQTKKRNDSKLWLSHT